MATNNTPLDPNAIAQEIVSNAESTGNVITQKQNPSGPTVKLAPGQSTQTTFNINSFDPRFPTGFITIVTDKNDNPVGWVKNGQVVPFLEPSLSLAEVEKQNSAKVAARNKISYQESALQGSFNYAQSLQDTASQEYQQMLSDAQIVARGEASPDQKAQLESIAKEYASTMVAIKTAYEKSGFVNGSVNLDPTTGKLATGSTYTDPSTKQPTTVTAQGSQTAPAAPSEPRYDANGNSLVPGTAAYAQGSTKKPAALNTSGPFGSANVVTNKGVGAGAGAGAGAGGNGNAGAGGGTAGGGTDTSATGFNQLDQYGQPIFTKVNQVGPESLTPGNIMEPSVSGPLSVNDQMAKMAKQYGAIGALALSTPWMLDILNEAVNAPNGAWDAKKFTNAIEADPRWAAMGTNLQAASLAFNQPTGEWATQYNATWQAMYNSAVSQGLDPSALGQKLDLSNQDAIAAAFKDQNNPVATLLNTYYADPQSLSQNLDRFVATHAPIAYNPASGTPQGQIAANIASLKSTLSDWGMSGTYTDAQLQDYAKKIQGGISGYDLNTFTAQQQQNAINTYKPFAEQLKSGQTVAQIAAPYMTTLTGLLEVQPSDVTLGSNTGYGKIISDALRGDANGNVIDPLSFANTVRQQPQWLNTKNAQSTLLGNANAIIQKMGLG